MGIDLNAEFRPNTDTKPWGPFIPDDYVVMPVTYRSVITAGVILGLTCIFALSAACIASKQTKAARNPWRSVYTWMIWLEIVASLVIGIECMLYLLKIIRPSFWFYMSILLNWSIQVQLLLQIIVNRIRVILANKNRGYWLTVVTAVIVGLINVSVFCIWMPARLQINERWIHINNIWDRTEKVLYLILDAFLNYCFIRVVKANLIEYGLEKYNTLVRFNQCMIVVSLLMDVMIIAAMSLPNGFVYAMFHPLGYLVKLNIEMCMAHLIRAIALDTRNGVLSFTSVPNKEVNRMMTRSSRSSIQQITIFRHYFGTKWNQNGPNNQRDHFVFAQNSESTGHSRQTGMHRDSLSWIDREVSNGFSEVDWTQNNSRQNNTASAVDDSRKSSCTNGPAFPGPPARARLDSRASQVC